MKRLIIFSFIITECFCESDLFAQQRPFGPSHPYIRYNPVRRSTGIDTVIESLIPYDLEGLPQKTEMFKIFYARSEDKLTDTIYYGLDPWVHRYNEKNQLLYSHHVFSGENFGPMPGYLRTNYEYDDEGRIVREEIYNIDPSGNPQEKLLAEQVWDYSTIQMTDKGFIYNDIECETDDQGRITLIKLFAKEDTIVELDGVKYRVNDDFYTYTDSSYTEFGCYYANSNTTPEGPIQWMISTVVFNENGYEKFSTMSVSEDGKNWRPIRELQTMYIYSGDDVSNFSIPKTNTSVYAQFGSIYVFTENFTNVKLYDINGRLVKQQALSTGENRINVDNGGFYIVKVGNESFKVFINF